ncbi:MAG: hypothetical protein R2753_12370 [Chitinophagales bacterium]
MKLKFYSFFTKYSLLESYGFMSGFTSRIFRKLIPRVAEEDSFEFYLKRSQFKRGDYRVASDILSAFLVNPEHKAAIINDLNKAIAALTTKVVSFGLDHEFQSYFKRLNINSECYQKLIFQIKDLSQLDHSDILKIKEYLDQISQTIIELRRNKNVIGTSLHLTMVTRRILDYIHRAKELLDLKSDIDNIDKWQELIVDYASFQSTQNSLRKYLNAHVDLLALEVVEHTSQKGEEYVASNAKEYNKFFRKGLLGGAIIAVFALFKILIDAHLSITLPRAFLYSLNYASCFLLVKFLGGTIATKQPAMTASTIIKHIDKDDDLRLDAIQDIIILLRKVARSQFISLIGNFLMAFSVSCLIAFILSLGFTDNPVSIKKSNYLIQQVFPFSGGGIFYAAIAGVFLALSGFISGYFDNRVIASNLPYRIKHHRPLSKITSKKMRDKISNYIEKSLGVIAGNVSLGFFLGSAFLLSYFLPLSIDIRHIAFSSANVGYAIINNAFSVSTILLALVSVLIIGFVNFTVSFSITFTLALKSRGITLKDLGQLIKLSINDIIRNPLDYLIIRKNQSLESNSNNY